MNGPTLVVSFPFSWARLTGTHSIAPTPTRLQWHRAHITRGDRAMHGGTRLALWHHPSHLANTSNQASGENKSTFFVHQPPSSVPRATDAQAKRIKERSRMEQENREFANQKLVSRRNVS